MPYADPKKRAAWYRERFQSDPEFRAKELARRNARRKTPRGQEQNRASSRRGYRRQQPWREFIRFNLDDARDALRYLDYVGSLKAAEIPFVARHKGIFATVSVHKADLAAANTRVT